MKPSHFSAGRKPLTALKIQINPDDCNAKTTRLAVKKIHQEDDSDEGRIHDGQR